MKLKIFALALPFFMTCAVGAADIELTPVYTDEQHQFTGVGISRQGRIFVNYPRWQEPHQYDVVEVASNGSPIPYPNVAWNSWNENLSGSNKWVCVQAVYVDDADRLWVVDPGAPMMQGVEPHSAKLVAIDLQTDQVLRVYDLTQVAGRSSYLNDVRVDTQSQTAYLTESKNGGLVVVDLTSGEARLVLAKADCTVADQGHTLTVYGQPLLRDGKPFKANADGIALTPDRQWLYFKALSDTKLYRVRTEDLRNARLGKAELAGKVENLGANFCASDGMIFDRGGDLYLGDMEHDAIVRVSPQFKKETVVTNSALLWPDTFAWSPGGWLYVSCSQIQTMAWSHNGTSTRTTPYTIYKMKVKAPALVK